jgi:multidrug transporter EmrE-like cation transporter
MPEVATTRRGQMMGYIYILGTVIFTVYGQLITKWQVTRFGDLPVGMVDKVAFIMRLVLNPWIISSLTAAFLAFVCWTMALSKFALSYAYPFTSLSFVLVSGLSAVFLSERITICKALGLILIMLGITIGSRG